MTAIVAMHGLTKSFSGNVVLNGVSFDIMPGEVHGLLGHNGSGKSTLIKVLAGVYVPDSGEVVANGHNVPMPIHPDEARRHGFAFVHQGLGLADNLTVLENLAVSNFRTGFMGQISWHKHVVEAEEMLCRFGAQINVRAKVAELEPVHQALVAIARALTSIESAGGGRMLVLDEPTVYLPREGIHVLFDCVRKLAAEGDAVLFVSHRLDEVLEITDRVTILREGRLVATGETADLSERDLVRMIVGRDLEDTHEAAVGLDHTGNIAVARDVVGGGLSGVTLSVAKGEILGLTGLAGSGYGQIPYILFGAASHVTGTLDIGSQHFDLATMSVHDAIKNGLALVPADRKRLGIALGTSVRENISMPSLLEFFRAGRLRLRAEAARVRHLVKEFNVLLSSQEVPIETLSGGNQQKAVLAKWISRNPRLLLLHEPTQGVDVGGRFEIWQHLRNAAARGAAVIVASEVAEELADNCDRVVIFRDGGIAAELRGSAVEKHAIIELTLSQSNGDGRSETQLAAGSTPTSTPPSCPVSAP